MGAGGEKVLAPSILGLRKTSDKESESGKMKENMLEVMYRSFRCIGVELRCREFFENLGVWFLNLKIDRKTNVKTRLGFQWTMVEFIR